MHPSELQNTSTPHCFLMHVQTLAHDTMLWAGNIYLWALTQFNFNATLYVALGSTFFQNASLFVIHMSYTTTSPHPAPQNFPSLMAVISFKNKM